MSLYFLLYILILNISFSYTSPFLFKWTHVGLDDTSFRHLDQKHSHDHMYGVSLANSTSNESVVFLEHYFPQRLDHSRPTEESIWNQRYFVNNLFYEKGGPIFLFVYGEAAASPKKWMKEAQWTSFAKKVNALCFGLEHRYHGKSNPTNNASTANLVYLNTEQALGDIAFFIEGMNSKYNLSVMNTKWILFGGSYAGSLVAWARLKYPHLIHGAVSSSAPLLAQTDFPEYLKVVETSLATHSADCVRNIASANRQLKLVINIKFGRAQVSRLFRLCTRLENNRNDISSLFEIISDIFSYAVQYNKKEFSINTICNIMNERKSFWFPQFHQYAEVINEFLDYIQEPCLPYKYEEFIKDLKNETSFSSDRLWLYQTCTEYGYYQTSSKPNDLFGEYFPLEYFIKICQDVFGLKFNKAFVDNAVQRTNNKYGGVLYNISNVIFVHGSLDPWQTLGITSRKNNSLYQVHYIKGATHCEDMRPPTDDDTENLKSTRHQIFKTIFNGRNPKHFHNIKLSIIAEKYSNFPKFVKINSENIEWLYPIFIIFLSYSRVSSTILYTIAFINKFLNENHVFSFFFLPHRQAYWSERCKLLHSLYQRSRTQNDVMRFYIPKIIEN